MISKTFRYDYNFSTMGPMLYLLLILSLVLHSAMSMQYRESYDESSPLPRYGEPIGSQQTAESRHLNGNVAISAQLRRPARPVTPINAFLKWVNNWIPSVTIGKRSPTRVSLTKPRGATVGSHAISKQQKPASIPTFRASIVAGLRQMLTRPVRFSASISGGSKKTRNQLGRGAPRPVGTQRQVIGPRPHLSRSPLPQQQHPSRRQPPSDFSAPLAISNQLWHAGRSSHDRQLTLHQNKRRVGTNYPDMNTANSENQATSLVLDSNGSESKMNGSVNSVDEDSKQQPYSYRYQVVDGLGGAAYEKMENSLGSGSTAGSYSVALPDGRVQQVVYRAGEHDGFQAEVSYMGKAFHPGYENEIAWRSGNSHNKDNDSAKIAETSLMTPTSYSAFRLDKNPFHHDRNQMSVSSINENGEKKSLSSYKSTQPNVYNDKSYYDTIMDLSSPKLTKKETGAVKDVQRNVISARRDTASDIVYPSYYSDKTGGEQSEENSETEVSSVIYAGDLKELSRQKDLRGPRIQAESVGAASSNPHRGTARWGNSAFQPEITDSLSDNDAANYGQTTDIYKKSYREKNYPSAAGVDGGLEKNSNRISDYVKSLAEENRRSHIEAVNNEKVPEQSAKQSENFFSSLDPNDSDSFEASVENKVYVPNFSQNNGRPKGRIAFKNGRKVLLRPRNRDSERGTPMKQSSVGDSVAPIGTFSTAAQPSLVQLSPHLSASNDQDPITAIAKEKDQAAVEEKEAGENLIRGGSEEEAGPSVASSRGTSGRLTSNSKLIRSRNRKAKEGKHNDKGEKGQNNNDLSPPPQSSQQNRNDGENELRSEIVNYKITSTPDVETKSESVSADTRAKIKVKTGFGRRISATRHRQQQRQQHRQKHRQQHRQLQQAHTESATPTSGPHRMNFTPVGPVQTAPPHSVPQPTEQAVTPPVAMTTRWRIMADKVIALQYAFDSMPIPGYNAI